MALFLLGFSEYPGRQAIALLVYAWITSFPGRILHLLKPGHWKGRQRTRCAAFRYTARMGSDSTKPLRLTSIAPGVQPLLHYRFADDFRHDLVAGISVAAVALPVAVAYAQLAGFSQLPPEEE